MDKISNSTVDSCDDGRDLVLQTVNLILLTLRDVRAVTLDWAPIGNDHAVYLRLLSPNGQTLHEFQVWGTAMAIVEKVLEVSRSTELLSVVMAVPALYFVYLGVRAAIQKCRGVEDEE